MGKEDQIFWKISWLSDNFWPLSGPCEYNNDRYKENSAESI